jgi:hypothetical protein
MDIKGIACYIAIVLIASFALQAAILFAGAPASTAYGLFIIPAIAAWLASVLSRSTAFKPGPAWPMDKGKALRMIFGIPIAFAIFYSLATLVGYVGFDPAFSEIMSVAPPVEELHVDPSMLPILPSILAAMGFAISLLLGPTLYTLAMLGNECGWRGYLLPRLAPMGKWLAHIVTGAIWGVSLLPFVLLAHTGHIAPDVLRLMGFTISLSLLLGEVWKRSGNLGLTALCGGCFFCQATTFWPFAVITPSTTLPFGAGFDEVSILIALVLTVGTRIFFGLKTEARKNELPDKQENANDGK